MEQANYSASTTSRGFVYHYYKSSQLSHSNSEPTPDDVDIEAPLPTILLLHGFPTTSDIWRNQVPYFQKHGFPLLVPDLLGFGGTSKPVAAESYRSSLICQDILDILDKEMVSKQAIAIGHGLGSTIVSRLANLHANRFLGFGFLAAAYDVPRSLADLNHTLRASKRMCGYELFGHIHFLGGDSNPGPDKLIESHMDSFYSAMFPHDPKSWVTQVAPLGALQAWLESDKCTPLPSYLTPGDKENWHAAFSKGDFFAPLCWHKVVTAGINNIDDASISLESYRIEKPVFFGAAHHDYIYRSHLGIAITREFCANATIREFQAGHWLMLETPDKVSAALYSWIMDVI